MWRRKKKNEDSPVRDKVAGTIAHGLLKLQERVSAQINKLFEGMSVKKLKISLFAFCLVSGGLSGYYLVSAVFSQPGAPTRIEQIKIPAHFDQPVEEYFNDGMPEDIYEKIQDYKRYMDSSRIPLSPGLRDSIQLLEEIYSK